MEADYQAQLSFFLTGRWQGPALEPVGGQALRPALLAGYRDLSELRYDYPVVLLDSGREHGHVQALSALIDAALAEIDKSGKAGDATRVRAHALRIEQELRQRSATGAQGTLSVLWTDAVAALAPQMDPHFAEDARRVRAAIHVDGALADCDARLPARLLRHAWRRVQDGKAETFRRTLQRLIHKLSDILIADFEHSAAGRSAQRLQASMGGALADAFDFDAMAGLLSRTLPQQAPPTERRRRVQQLLEVLTAQRFVAVPGVSGAAAPYGFEFDSCGAALDAFRARMPELTALARAIAIAELEIDGQFQPARHDALFEAFGANGLDPHELAAFPDSLVCLNAAQLQGAEQMQLMEMLSSGLPIKLLFQIDDLLDAPRDGQGNLAPGLRSRQVAHMAIGLNEVYVLQSASSNLVKMRERVGHALAYRGPALFSIYSGAAGAGAGLTPYLSAAAAMESRAFPAFAYDPSAGPNWASRFSLDTNPQIELDWPVQGFGYEDEQHQRQSQDLAFTFVDFIATDPRYARHLARVPRERWNGSMVAVDETLARERKGLPERVPSVMMVGSDDVLQRLVVDERLIREARRCREMWHSLQELGGVHNSHAEQLLARERKAWEERMHQEAETQAAAVAAVAPAAAPPAASPAPAAAAAEAAPEPGRTRDDAYIETERCSTCNECTQLNPRMFAYNDNQQAYIKDISAGSYAQLVEAAENCQVAVIHPGKPRDPNEPGLKELLERAEAFR